MRIAGAASQWPTVGAIGEREIARGWEEQAMKQSKPVIVVAAVFAALILAGQLGGIYVDWLWFQSVGMESVFATRLLAQIVLFVVSAVVFFAAFIANVLLAMRLSPPAVAAPLIVVPPWERSHQRQMTIKLAATAVGLLLAVLIGAGVAANWAVVLRFLNPTSFGAADPLFGQDVSFFVFTLPVYGLLQSLYVTTAVLCLVGAAVTYIAESVLPRLAASGESFQGDLSHLSRSLSIGQAGKMHLSILVALVALGFAWGSWLDIYHLVFSPSGLVFGAGYADVHARWPAQYAVIGATVLFALLALVNARRPGYRLLLLGLGVWVAAALVGGDIYPAVVQRLEVQPSELDKERPFIEYNIKMTNQAYALDRIAEIDYPAVESVSAAEINDNPGTIKNIRLWDPQPLLDTYNQVQSIRLYYDFLDIDVDRYMIDGEYRQVMLSARELSPSKLPSQAQTWVNRRLQYTHGYGVAVSPVNEVTPEGLPELFVKDVPPRGKLEISRPEIYYGENTSDYVIVKTTTPEFDYPKGDENVYVEYEGDSGVAIGSYLRRLLFAWQFGDANILLTGAIKPESKILYNRNIKERVQMVAPFLAYDRDPYIVVANGRLYWMLDAYTFTNRYPYSQPVSLQSELNYMRNSVKVVVDAYEGRMQFYLADETDPLVHTYDKIFPGLFKPLDEMPPELRSHVRYPEDLFSVQVELYRTYHMKDARVFYNKEDLWNLPSEIYLDKQVPMQPYYVIMRLPGAAKEEFALILPYTPPNKNNMITWLAARSDGEDYGSLIAYKFPKDKLIYGPLQIEARIDQDPRISEQLTLWNQAGSRVIRGNLIVIPIGNSSLYVEPIYLQSEQSKLPEMKRVIIANGNSVVMEPTVSVALAKIFAGQVASPGVPTSPAEPGPAAAAPAFDETAKELLDRLAKLQEELKTLENDLRKLLQEPQTAR